MASRLKTSKWKRGLRRSRTAPAIPHARSNPASGAGTSSFQVRYAPTRKPARRAGNRPHGTGTDTSSASTLYQRSEAT